MSLARHAQQYGFANLHAVSRNGNVPQMVHEGGANVLSKEKNVMAPCR